jgi:tol-pal system protein YbgF
VAQDQEQVQKTAAQLAAMDQRLRQLDQDIDALRRTVELLRAAGPGQTPVARPGAPGAPGGSAPARTGTVTPPAGGRAEAIYKEAFEHLNKRDYAKARERFEAFLKADPNSDFAEGAMYLIADTYYKQKDYENAILRYEELVARFPGGRRVPASLFYQALAFRELGAPKDARLLLERVVKSYPNSTEAKLAKAELPKLPAP